MKPRFLVSERMVAENKLRADKYEIVNSFTELLYFIFIRDYIMWLE